MDGNSDVASRFLAPSSRSTTCTGFVSANAFFGVSATLSLAALKAAFLSLLMSGPLLNGAGDGVKSARRFSAVPLTCPNQIGYSCADQLCQVPQSQRSMRCRNPQIFLLRRRFLQSGLIRRRIPHCRTMWRELARSMTHGYRRLGMGRAAAHRNS